MKLGASDTNTIGHVLGNKPETSSLKVTAKRQQQQTPESTKDEPALKKKTVEAFELPGILTEAPKVLTFLMI